MSAQDEFENLFVIGLAAFAIFLTVAFVLFGGDDCDGDF